MGKFAGLQAGSAPPRMPPKTRSRSLHRRMILWSNRGWGLPDAVWQQAGAHDASNHRSHKRFGIITWTSLLQDGLGTAKHRPTDSMVSYRRNTNATYPNCPLTPDGPIPQYPATGCKRTRNCRVRTDRFCRTVSGGPAASNRVQRGRPYVAQPARDNWWLRGNGQIFVFRRENFQERIETNSVARSLLLVCRVRTDEYGKPTHRDGDCVKWWRGQRFDRVADPPTHGTKAGVGGCRRNLSCRFLSTGRCD